MGFTPLWRYIKSGGEKMRIVHVIDYFQPQLGYQETFVPQEQAKMGHDVYMVTSDRYSPLLYRGDAVKSLMGARIRKNGFFIENAIRTWRLKTLFEIPHVIWMSGLENKIRELKPDIVILHGIVSFSAIRIALLKKKQNNFKLIYDDHATFDNSRSKLYPLFRWTFSRLIQEAADAIVGVVPETKIFMNKKFGISLENITIIPLGADDTLFRFNETARQEIRSKLHLKESDIVFIYTGKFTPKKRLDILVDAVKIIENKGGLKVLLVGNGTPAYVEELKRDIKTKNLGDKFIWHDMVPNKELYRFYSAADVAVWPRTATASIQEAMACRLPVIINEVSRVTELVSNNNGLLCQENALSLAHQMEKLLNPKLRVEMGRNGRKLVEEKLNWRIIARQFIELVEPE